MWLMDETLMYYSWHLIMLESKIVAMLFGGVIARLHMGGLSQRPCIWLVAMSMPIGICHIRYVHIWKDRAFGCLSLIMANVFQAMV